MGITTKGGDHGRTDLLFGRRVRKDDLRIEAVGALDELNSFLGLAKCRVTNKRVRRLIHSCQRDIFIVSSEFAIEPRDARRLMYRVDNTMVSRLTLEIEKLERRLKLKECCFLIPGETYKAALLDICRCLTRRAERIGVMARRRHKVPTRVTLIYLNRLSDLLYLLARSEAKRGTPFVAG